MVTKQKFMSRFQWSHLLFLTLTPLIALFGTIWVYQTGQVHWATWVLFFVMLYATGCGIGAGYHRLYSHRAYQASWPVRLFLLFFGAAAFEGSIKHWCAQHRNHHRYVDTDQDPYNIKRGFWYAHCGWVVLKPKIPVEYSNIKDIGRDPLAEFQHRFYIPIAALVSFLLPALIASLWGNFLAGLFIAGVLRLVLNHHFTFLINSYCHFFGKKTFSDVTTARDSAFIAFFTYGEGYHNFHHTFETDYRNGYRPWHWDPNKWLIYFYSLLGLARGLKRTDEYRILAAKLEMEKYILEQRWTRFVPADKWQQKIKPVVERTFAQLQEAHQKFRQLSKQYKEQKIDHLLDQLQKAKKDFQTAMQEWRLIVEGQHPVCSVAPLS